MQSLRTSCAQAQLAHFFCPCTVHRRVWDSYDGATFAFARVRHDWASHEWLPRSPGLFVVFFSRVVVGGYTRPFVYRPGDTVSHTGRWPARNISRVPTSLAMSHHVGDPDRTACQPPRTPALTIDHIRTLSWLHLRSGGAHTRLAPRAVDLRYWGRPARRRPSPRLARRRARPATLRSPPRSPNLSWWCEAVLAGDSRPHSRAGSCMDTRRQRACDTGQLRGRVPLGRSAFLAL